MNKSFRVVLIDDDPDLRQLIKLSLEFAAGWEVIPAANGSEGLEAVRAVRPDAALVDVMMPDMDGYEVCRQLKADEVTAGIPLILLTARKELDASRLEESGIAGVLYKPFEPDELPDRIRELCGGEG